ncbi:DUF58 domain-containing protein [Paenibacillus hexagrammi]|uniref:DUF58 domain-containing protein n=1 Tax=Paenibacillus hexagrammi TaxID=2908839 RepID=A0ABY3SIG5_9BACL|nr:DUF58 domain-containing protein [Paenibacillus sp. YPD9-1]UJF32757.1 DUF58 domain-containing protein [Paenibacillus sp. YPD9-1]
MRSSGKMLLLTAGCVLLAVLVFRRGGFAAWFVLDIFLMIWLQAALLQVSAFRGFRIERTLSQTVGVSGQELDITLQIAHSSWLPMPWLLIKESWTHSAFEGKVVYRRLLFPWFRKSIVLRYRITGLMRGVYRFAQFEAATGDLFGFAVSRAQGTSELSCVVYPKPDSLSRAVMTFQSEDGDKPAQGLHSSAIPMVGGVRDYVSGDPYHRIHWKSTAKLGRLMTKEAERTASAKKMLLLDASPTSASPDASRPLLDAAPAGIAPGSLQPLLEKGIALAAGFFEAAARAGDSCGFASSSAQDRRIAPAIRQDLTLAYEALASLGGRLGLSFPDLVRKEAGTLPPDTSMLCITSTLGQDLLRAIAEARSRRRAVHVVYVHARRSPLGHRPRGGLAAAGAGLQLHGSAASAERVAQAGRCGGCNSLNPGALRVLPFNGRRAFTPARRSAAPAARDEQLLGTRLLLVAAAVPAAGRMAHSAADACGILRNLYDQAVPDHLRLVHRHGRLKGSLCLGLGCQKPASAAVHWLHVLPQ